MQLVSYKSTTVLINFYPTIFPSSIRDKNTGTSSGSNCVPLFFFSSPAA